MTKSQLKERSTLLISFAMMIEGFRLIELDPMKVDLSKFEDKLDMKLVNLYRKLSKLNRMFSSKKIANFLDKRLSKIEDTLQQQCQPLYIGLLIIYFYKKIDTKKEFVLNELNNEEIKQIFYEANNEFGITDCTINKAIKIFKSIYPDKEAYINYLQLTNKFPFDILSNKKDKEQ